MPDCEVCGTFFEYPLKNSSKNKRYCSISCRNKAVAIRRKDDPHYHPKWAEVSRVCRTCGKKFKTTLRNGRWFCGDECAHEADLEHGRKYKRVGACLLTKKCLVCGVAFQTHQSSGKYCSQLCLAVSKTKHDNKYFCYVKFGKCAECGVYFSSGGQTRNKRFCTYKCKMRAGSRAKYHQHVVDGKPYAISRSVYMRKRRDYYMENHRCSRCSAFLPDEWHMTVCDKCQIRGREKDACMGQID